MTDRVAVSSTPPPGPGHTWGTPHRSTATNDDNRCTAPRRQTAWAALFPQAEDSPEALS